MMWGYAGGWMWMGMVAFWVIVAVALVWGFSTSGRRGSSRDEGRRILENRFARGEIDETEFESRLTALDRKR